MSQTCTCTSCRRRTHTTEGHFVSAVHELALQIGAMKPLLQTLLLSTRWGGFSEAPDAAAAMLCQDCGAAANRVHAHEVSQKYTISLGGLDLRSKRVLYCANNFEQRVLLTLLALLQPL